MSRLGIFVDGRTIKARFHVAHRISGAAYGLDRLHGHTYDMRVSLEGKGQADFLYPFEALMETMTECAQALDNKVLLADGGDNVAKFDNGVITYVGADEKRYMFPKDDVMFLPVKEVTAEALAKYLLKEICEKLRKSDVSTSEISGVELTLWEGYERGVVARGTL
jgi:6-pyruvoyltetrahydropterin/6-carboxytetrahydropterin synthase